MDAFRSFLWRAASAMSKLARDLCVSSVPEGDKEAPVKGIIKGCIFPNPNGISSK